MQFAKLASYLDKLENTSSRNTMTEILAEVFEITPTAEIEAAVNLLLGQLAPSYKNIVFNIAEQMLQQALAQAYGRDLKDVKKLYKEKGDLGDVAFALAQDKKTQIKDQKYPVDVVYKKLLAIAKDEGESSVERKIDNTAKLLSELDAVSAKYVARIPIGKLRLGFSDKTIIDALSYMETGDKSLSAELEKAYFVLPNVGLLAHNVKKYGSRKACDKVSPEVGTPVLPMLAQRLKSPTEMINKMSQVLVEPKFDGLRIQIHYKAGKEGFVKAFTRNLNETAWMFPELQAVAKQIKAKEVILDTEGIGVDEKRKSLANFQQTMTRRRKHDIEKIASSFSIKFYVFDVLYKDGMSLMTKTNLQRRKVLEKTIKDGRVLEVVDYLTTLDPEVIKKQMEKYKDDGLEGIMVKKADSTYVSGRTGWRWVKMKEQESAKAKLADTIDAVVMGYYRGRGKRTAFGVGGFLVGIPAADKILSLTKIGTGLTDDQFRELKKRLTKLEVGGKPKEYGEIAKILTPDVWTQPSLVVEIAADEITKSPNHSSGLAVRFPRLVKFRDDKNTDQATNLSEIKKLYKLQK